MPLINFELRHPDNIAPWGNEPTLRLPWFGLTDSYYWLDLQKVLFYEYSNEVLADKRKKSTRFVDYQTIRFIEDFTSIFEMVSEEVPDDFYAITKSYNSFTSFLLAARGWLDSYTNNPKFDTDEHYADQYSDKYHKSIEWIYDRAVSSRHLIGGPVIFFMRNKEMISIIWNADNTTEEGTPIWTAQNGTIEIKYDDFIREVEDFGERFFSAMDQQVEISIHKEWGRVSVDKTRLSEEQIERRATFNEHLLLLKSPSKNISDWTALRSIIEKMQLNVQFPKKEV